MFVGSPRGFSHAWLPCSSSFRYIRSKIKRGDRLHSWETKGTELRSVRSSRGNFKYLHEQKVDHPCFSKIRAVGEHESLPTTHTRYFLRGESSGLFARCG